MAEFNDRRLSKFLSLLLRHKPEIIGIELDENGWTDVETLIRKLNDHGEVIELEQLRQIVKTNPKQRFSFDADEKRIRANQGHSVSIDLQYTSVKPPNILYHGTAKKNVESILVSGLTKQERHHVHLSTDLQTALSVGQRYGQPHVFEINAEKMFSQGFEFFCSSNGVWLTEKVPPEFLKIHS